MSYFDLSECTTQLSEHAYALWVEAAMLTRLAKKNPTLAHHPIALLAKKSAEVCRLAQMIHESASDCRSRSTQPSAPRSPRPNERRRA